MSELYIYSIISSAICLAGWMIFEERGHIAKLFQAIFYISILGYIGSHLSMDLDSKVRISTILRDAFGICGISGIFMIVRKNLVVSLALFGLLVYSTPTLIDFLKENKPNFISSDDTKDTQEKDWEILLELHPGTQTGFLTPIIEKYNLSIEQAFEPEDYQTTDLDDYYSIDIPEAIDDKTDQIYKEIKKCTEVESISINQEYKIEPLESSYRKEKEIRAFVNDPLVGQQWSYSPLEMNKYYSFFEKNKIKPVRKAKLFILDSGVAGTHEDLAENYIKFDGGSDLDDIGHGTHVAGIAGAVTNNGKGRSSMAPTSDYIEVYSIKVLRMFGMATQKTIIAGIIKAVDAGADVISMSLGGKSSASRQKAYNEVMQYAKQHNTIVVVAAGNSSIDASKYCPANSADVITVSALNQEMNRAQFSNTLENIRYGIAAPGKDILSTYPRDEYKAFSGTSMATPFVSGLVATMKSIRPALDLENAYRILQTTGKPMSEEQKTGRCIQPFRAVSLLVGESVN